MQRGPLLSSCSAQGLQFFSLPSCPSRHCSRMEIKRQQMVERALKAKVSYYSTLTTQGEGQAEIHHAPI